MSHFLFAGSDPAPMATMINVAIRHEAGWSDVAISKASGISVSVVQQIIARFHARCARRIAA